jgi:hypothetical protein
MLARDLAEVGVKVGRTEKGVLAFNVHVVHNAHLKAYVRIKTKEYLTEYVKVEKKKQLKIYMRIEKMGYRVADPDERRLLLNSWGFFFQ